MFNNRIKVTARPREIEDFEAKNYVRVDKHIISVLLRTQ